MNIPEIFDVIDQHLLMKWRDEIEKYDDCIIMKKSDEYKENLATQLNDEQKKLLRVFELAVENKMDYIYYDLCKQLFYFAVRAGMQMQKAYDEAD